MKTIIKLAFVISGLAFSAITTSSLSYAKEYQLDKVVAVVNTGVVLESEIDELVNNVKKQALAEKQSLPSDTALRTQAMEKLINDTLLIEMGERMGVQISDAQLDQTITTIAKDNGGMSLEKFRQK